MGCGLGWTHDVNPSGCLEHKKLSQMCLATDVPALGLPCSIIGICLAIYLMTFESYLGLWQEEDKWYTDYKTSERLPDMKTCLFKKRPHNLSVIESLIEYVRLPESLRGAFPDKGLVGMSQHSNFHEKSWSKSAFLLIHVPY